MAENKPILTPEEIDHALAQADGVMGAAGHEINDPVARDIYRRVITQEITPQVALVEIKQNLGLR